VLRSNVKAELAVLSTLANTTKRDKQGELMMRLRPEYFGTDATREIYDQIVDLNTATHSIPTFRTLKHAPNLSKAALALLNNHSGAILKRSEIDTTIKIVQDFYTNRVIYDMHDMLGKSIAKGKEFNAEKAASLLERAISQLRNPGGATEDLLHGGIGDPRAGDIVINVLKGEQCKKRIKTGWDEFDRRTGGFNRSDLVVLTATFGGGKSVAALTLYRNMHRAKHSVALASMEMDQQEIIERLLSSTSKVEYSKLRLGTTSKEEKKTIINSFDAFDASGGRWSLFTPSREVTIQDIFNTLSSYKYDVIFIDYIGLLKHMGNNKNMREDQLLGETARYCKIKAKELNCVVVLLAQLNDEGKVFGARAITHHANFWFKWNITDEDKTKGFVTIEQGKARGAECYDFTLTTNFRVMEMSTYDGPVDDKKSGPSGDKKKSTVKMSLMDD
jgi:replicative DNA helicase